MIRSTLQSTTVHIATYLFILLFVYAAASKLLDFETFETQLGQSPLLSAYAQWVAFIVPVLEIVIAGLLCFPVFRNIGLYGFYTMMVMFTAYIVIILNFTSFTPCSCGGVLEDLGWTEHLIFNSAFIVLSGVSLLWDASNKRKTLMTLSVLTLFGISVVAGTFSSSEKQIKRNNAFIRRYMPHALEKIGEYDLKFNSYYIAGMNDHTIYLGNFTTPLTMTTLDTTLAQVKELRISMDSLHLPYRRVRLAVKSPYFYLVDGTIPVLFRGKINEWHPKVFSYNGAYFMEFVVADSLNIGITTKTTSTRSTSLGLIQKARDTIKLKLNTNILSRQIEKGVFGSDGILLWNDTHQQFIYTYYYKNQYEKADRDMTYQATGKTIDTIGTPILDIAHDTSKDAYKLGGKTILVNRQSATDGDYLYIHSDRLGRFEGENVLQSASIIDVYTITDNTYAFSFYLYHQRDKKLSEFRVNKDLLVAIVDDQLILYRLKPKYFNSGSNTTHTAQYQD
jgi:hypothetical protein